MIDTNILNGSVLRGQIDELDKIYTQIEQSQIDWKKASPAHCPDGCGQCCEDFEPDVLECEAIYLAFWLIQHKTEVANEIINGSYVSPRNIFGNTGKGCFLYNPAIDEHCTVYGGRTLICRLFGYSGDYGKDGTPRWKPCRFIPHEKLNKGTEHRQYTATELQEKYQVLPPIMSDFLAQVIALSPDEAGVTEPLRQALPKAIAKIKLILQFLSPETPEPEPNSPQPTTPTAA